MVREHSPPVATRERESRLLQVLARALPLIAQRLREPSAWRGIHVSEPDASDRYDRIVCNDELVLRNELHYSVGVHAFAAGFCGRMHNHRWPLAVFPLGGPGVLYEMPWELRDGDRVVRRGQLDVRAGEPWAIESYVEVHHAVVSRAAYFSIVLSDVTKPASRDNRLRTEPMMEAEVRALADAAVTTLER